MQTCNATCCGVSSVRLSLEYRTAGKRRRWCGGAQSALRPLTQALRTAGPGLLKCEPFQGAAMLLVQGCGLPSGPLCSFNFNGREEGEFPPGCLLHLPSIQGFVLLPGFPAPQASLEGTGEAGSTCAGGVVTAARGAFSTALSCEFYDRPRFKCQVLSATDRLGSTVLHVPCCLMCVM